MLRDLEVALRLTEGAGAGGAAGAGAGAGAGEGAARGPKRRSPARKAPLLNGTA